MRVWEEWVARWAGWRAGAREGCVYRGWGKQGVGGDLLSNLGVHFGVWKTSGIVPAEMQHQHRSHAPAFWEAPGSDLRQAIVSEANVCAPPPQPPMGVTGLKIGTIAMSP